MNIIKEQYMNIVYLRDSIGMGSDADYDYMHTEQPYS